MSLFYSMLSIHRSSGSDRQQLVPNEGSSRAFNEHYQVSCELWGPFHWHMWWSHVEIKLNNTFSLCPFTFFLPHCSSFSLWISEVVRRKRMMYWRTENRGAVALRVSSQLKHLLEGKSLRCVSLIPNVICSVCSLGSLTIHFHHACKMLLLIDHSHNECLINLLLQVIVQCLSAVVLILVAF